MASSDFDDRLERLEATVAALQREVAALRRRPPEGAAAEGAAAEPSPDPTPSPPAASPIGEGRAAAPRTAAPYLHGTPGARGKAWFEADAWRSENWISRVGIALVLFGLVFLFRYSIEQGWITPVVRVGFGAALGVGLGAAGLRLLGTRVAFAHLLLGGSIATFYATLFAAFQLYALLPHPLAFALMGVVTLAAFAMALRQDAVALAVIGVVGGLATPFLLFNDSGNLPGLVLYTILILALAAATYGRRGWRSVLFSAWAGGWVVWATAYVVAFVWETETFAERLALQSGVGFSWLVFGVMPVVRLMLHQRRPAAWPDPPVPSRLVRFVPRHPEAGLALSTAVLAALFSRALWDWPDWLFALSEIGLAGGYTMALLGLRRMGHARLAYVHGIVAALLVALALVELLSGPSLPFALGLEATGLMLLTRREGLRPTARLLGLAAIALFALALSDWATTDASRALGYAVEAVAVLLITRRWGDVDEQKTYLLAVHLLAAASAGLVLFYLMGTSAERPPLVNGQALAALAAVGALMAVSGAFEDGRTPRVYRLGGYLLLLGWLYHQLYALPNGQAYATAAWAGVAVALLVLGLRRDHDGLRLTALATIGLVVVKLFLVDLARLAPLWRVLLFLGVGGALLVVSYFVPRLFRPAAETEEPADAPV